MIGFEHCMQTLFVIVVAFCTEDELRLQREMLALGEAGYKEVTLLGQNIDAYGRDLPGAAADGSGRRAWTFTDLLHYVHDVPGIERIRFATSHPRFAAYAWQLSVRGTIARINLMTSDT